MMGFFDISCKKASRLISESQEHRLSWLQNIQLKMHLGVCDACKLTLEQFATLKKIFAHYSKLAGQIPPSATSSALSAKARERIKSSLKKNNP